MRNFSHVPVMLCECLACLDIQEGAVCVDGTLGGGGHAEAMLRKGARVIGIDRDMEAVRSTAQRLSRYGDRFLPVHGNFADMPSILGELGIDKVSAILLDLGVSSHQIDTPERGFSFQAQGPLDMRMDTTQTLTAADVLNTYPERELTRILREYGEEKWAARIAQFIVKARPLQTTDDLVRVIDAAVPAAARRLVQNPARRSFQAIRLEVNGELRLLDGALESAMDCLTPRGRLAVITFHSLEDRIVKTAFRRMEDPCVCPPDFPVCVCGLKSKARVITKKPIFPSPGEIAENPRSHSAKVRCAEHIAQEE